ncbi:MAG TPA: type IX secretion system membrane protein PorP/SprF [Chitinophagales bacterium]
MKKIITNISLMLIAVFGLRAQQDPAYTMYLFNGLFINPAYAGSRDVISLSAIYRHQWVGMEGAPRTANISVDMPFKQNQYAMGMIVSNDKIGLANTLSVTPSFSYRIKIKQTKLCFGIQASFAYFYRNNGQSDLPTNAPDNVLAGNTNMFVPNIGFGIYWYGRKFFVGLSAPHLMPTSLSGKTAVLNYNSDVARVYNFYNLSAGYVFGKETAVVKFRPSFLMKWQTGLPHNIPQIDFNLALLFIDRIWIGGSVRTQGDAYTKDGKVMKFGVESFMCFLQARITPQLQFGYAYDLPLSTLRTVNSGTHEVMLGYIFLYNKSRFVNPRFVSYF